MDLQSRFREIIRTEDELRAVMGSPSALVTRKELDQLDSHAREFIDRSPFLIIGTTGSDGRIDMSPKGDPPGFVKVLDDKTLAIPERLGNRRADTFSNLVVNPQVGLIFLIPGKQETLRVSGRALIVRDVPLRQSMEVSGKVPEFAIVVEVTQMFFHCAKCMIRSNLWKPEYWPALSGLSSLAETMVSAGKLEHSVQEMQKIVDNDAATRLY